MFCLVFGDIEKVHYVKYGGHHYLHIDQKATYCEAEQFCATLSGRLVARNFRNVWKFAKHIGLRQFILGFTDTLISRWQPSSWAFSWGSEGAADANDDAAFIEEKWWTSNKTWKNIQNPKQACTQYFKEKVMTVSCHLPAPAFICETDTEFADHAKYKDVVPFYAPDITNENRVCFSRQTNYRNLNDCREKYFFNYF